MPGDSQSQSEDNGRQGMTDRYQGRHGGVEYEEEEIDDTTPTCVCPKCGYKGPSDEDTPCSQQSCPKCGSAMNELAAET
ncbi:MAG: hypothetical protein NTZ09_01865 [Candidatus Hydrogenedentes bacterium]|nr:hypothetical protein [Candidatus Hydrogenedentota bacterium]